MGHPTSYNCGEMTPISRVISPQSKRTNKKDKDKLIEWQGHSIEISSERPFLRPKTHQTIEEKEYYDFHKIKVDKTRSFSGYLQVSKKNTQQK